MTWTDLLLISAILLLTFVNVEIAIQTLFSLILAVGALLLIITPFYLLWRGVVKLWYWITGD